MWSLKINLFLCLLFPFHLTNGDNDLRLQLVQVLFRHGDRTPDADETFPYDLYGKQDYQPWGYGQLTNQGRRREYKIGLLLRKLYGDFLGKEFLPKNVYAVSVDKDRTKASLQLALAGLFPPTFRQIWNPYLEWLPIPTHYAPKYLDAVMQPYRCNKYIAAEAKVYDLPEIKQKINSYKEFFKFLSVNTGKNFTNLEDVYTLNSMFKAQKAMNLKLPSWVNNSVMQKIEEATIFQNHIYCYTTEMKRLNGGPLLRKFLTNINNTITRKSPRKVYLYSGQQSNLVAVLHTLGVQKVLQLPDFGAALILEYLRDSKNNNFIKLAIWTGSTERLSPVKLANCDTICPLEKFMGLLLDVIPFRDEMNCLANQITIDKLRKFGDE